MRRLLSAFVLLVLTSSVWAQPIKALSWNLESGGADPDVIAAQIGAFQDYQLYGFSEVNDDDAAVYATACTEDEAGSFEFLVGTTGGNDRLMLVWDADRFEAVEELEMMELRAQTGRAPLAVRLRERNTSHTFWFMVNHLHRGNEDKRNEQAAGLRDWFSQQSLPVIACGDWNLDVDPNTLEGNEAFDILQEGNHARWVKPPMLMPTQSSSHMSVLDFFFINDDAAAWQISSTIIQLQGGFSPVDEKSDHRPIDATITIPTTPTPRRGVSPIVGRIAQPDTPLRGAIENGRLRTLDRVAADSVTTAPASRPTRLSDAEILEQIRAMREQLDRLEQAVRNRR